MDQSSFKHITVLVTAPTERAGDIARGIVESQLAACVNIVPSLRSIYRWQGKICDEQESLLIIKSRASCFSALREKVLELHPYEVPEVIALPITEGHLPYLQWIDDSTQ
jgi:periplasmic divalent cation tolerance protein